MLWLLAAATFVSPPIAPVYSVDTWQVDHGLPQNSVISMIQTRDGYLWLGTWAGLVRFDGVRFTPVADDLPNNHILALAEHPDGSVWIGTDGGGVARWEHHTLTQFTTADGLPHDVVSALAADAEGRVWMATTGGVAFIDANGITIPPADGPVRPTSLAVTDDGVWVGTTEGLCLARPQGVECRDVWPEVSGYVWSLARDGQERLAVSGPGGIVQIVDRATGTAQTICDATCAGGEPLAVLVTRDGATWVGFRGALVRVGPEGVTRFGAADGVPTEILRTLYEDAEGSVWVGTDGGGLARLRPTRVTALGTEHGLVARVVTSIVQDADGTVLTGGRCSPLMALGADGRFRSRLTDVTRGACVVPVLAARDGTIWLGAEGLGLVGWRDGEARVIRPEAGLSSSMVVALFEDRDGALWISTSAPRVHRLHGTRLETFGPDDGLPPSRVVAFAEDAEGRLWLGSNASGLFLHEEGRFHDAGGAEGLPTRLVSSLRVDSRGDLWIGTANRGLYRRRAGGFEHFGPEHGLPDPVVALAIEDAESNLWVSTSRGISRLLRDRIEAVARGDVTSLDPLVLGKADGMRSLEGSGGGFDPAGLRDRDGRLWFSTLDGIVVIDPRTLPLNQVPPPVAVEHVILDETTRAYGTTGGVRIPAGTRGVEIAFTAFSLLAPDRVRFRYRLAGFEQEWHEVGGRRSAFYTNLPPASYTFEVFAANNDGVWSPAPATLGLTVAPLWWQRTSVRAFALVLLLAFTGGVVRTASLRRARRRVAELEGEQALTRERSRIARDLHDEIGARLTHLALLADRSGETGARAELSATARETARTMDELVWSVNATNDTVESLATYAMRFAERHARAAGLRCRFDAPTAFRGEALPADVRRHVFLAIKEAVNNVVKHAHATELGLSFGGDAAAIEIAVTDDGRGFATDVGGGGHGLTGMRERMTAVGGSLTLASAPGSGTTVRFRVPLAAGASGRMPMR